MARRDGLPHGAVIAATELGEAGAEALARADAWARRMNAPLVVAHAMASGDALVPLFPQSYQPLASPERIAAVATAVRAQVAATTGRTADDYDVDIEQGSAHATIVTLAEDIAPRLLVVGASRKSPVEHALLGSTAEQILRHAPCSVLVARPGGDGPIVVATDFSDAALPAERAAALQARLWNKELVLLHALDVYQPITATFEPGVIIDETTLSSLRQSAEKLSRATLERIGMPGRIAVVVGDPGRTIVKQAEDAGAFMIVVATHGRTGLARIALGSVAERVARMAPCPVLVERTAR
jgi:nucleotide-binding universal stress UspA family protein